MILTFFEGNVYVTFPTGAWRTLGTWDQVNGRALLVGLSVLAEEKVFSAVFVDSDILIDVFPMAQKLVFDDVPKEWYMIPQPKYRSGRRKTLHEKHSAQSSYRNVDDD